MCFGRDIRTDCSSQSCSDDELSSELSTSFGSLLSRLVRQELFGVYHGVSLHFVLRSLVELLDELGVSFRLAEEFLLGFFRLFIRPLDELYFLPIFDSLFVYLW